MPNADSLFTKLFDADLNTKTIACSELFSKPTVIISYVNCMACTEYFTRHKKHFNFVFVLNNESLAEIGRILVYHNLKKSEVLFTICNDIPHVKSNLCSGPTPCMAYKRGSSCYFLDYSQLSGATDEFSLKIKALNKKLEAGAKGSP